LKGLDGLWWLLLLSGLLLILQKYLHQEIQGVFLLVTRNPSMSQILFAILFFPGVLLHETSHYLMARVLGVRTGRFSLVPQQIDERRLQLGYVETAQTDVIRDGLIGAAPLLAGGIAVAYIGFVRFDLPAIWLGFLQQGLQSWQILFARIFQNPDFWLWVYLAFVISSTMMPSKSDRKAWLPIGAVVALLLGISLLAGAGPWLVVHFTPVLNMVFRSIAIIFGISVVLHLIFWLPCLLLRLVLERVTGLRIA
jgi:hypothetical protein